MKPKQATATKRKAVKISRPGIHAKSKAGTHKSGKNYSKPYRGQGR